ncbi:MAG: ATP-binding protein, partial [Candidatus Diapherotrites archaeon]|nr:ATP-binding protein [Candidatus Diapherotrites archaeon]
ICSQTDFDASIFIHPSSIDNVLTTLNYELVKQRSDILSMEQKGLVNPSLQIQYDDTLSTLKNLQKGEEKLFYFSLYMNLKSETKEKLELVTKKILGELNSIMIQTLVPKMLMGKAIQTIIPLNNNTLNTKKEITSSALSACFPFTTSFLEEKPTGIIFGINKSNNIPVILDVFKLPNQNGIVLASSGAGKSYAVKSLILKNTFNGIKTIIIDPQAEYSSLAKECSGQVVKISENSESMINPLDLMGHSFSEKMFSLMSLYAIMFPEINPIQKAILDKATIECYKEFKIIPESPETWNNEMPTLADLLKEISKIKTSSKGLDKRDVELIESRLKMFVTGSFSFLNKKTKIKISEKGIVSFDIKELPSNIKPVVMFLILDWLLKKMQKSQEKTSVIFDEGWSLLRTAEQSDYLFQMIKTARKFGTGITVITQEVQDLINSNAGRAILANTSWKLLLRQEPSVIKELIQTFNLNQEETNILLTS